MSAEIKLEAGQWYRRRDGEIVYCFAKNPVNVNYPYHLCCEDGAFETVDEAGDFCDDTDDDDEDIIEHLPDCTGFDWAPTPKLQLREGAWYERKDGRIKGPCKRRVGGMATEFDWIVGEYSYNDVGVTFFNPNINLIREVEPPQPKYRAFKDAEEFRPFRDKWLVSNGSDAFSSGFERVISYDNVRVYITIGESTDWWTYKEAMDRFTFEDGSPFGVLDDGT
jgi:hypothetical protein